MGNIDVVVSDLGLPDGSGLDLIKGLHTKKHCPAIALSGYGTHTDIQRCKEASFDRHLTKPVKIERLTKAIRGLLRQAQAGRDASLSL
jgi:CheY-like chemotaxis protein